MKEITFHSNDGKTKAILKKVEEKYGLFSTIGYDDQQNLCVYKEDGSLVFSCNKLTKELDLNCLNEFLKLTKYFYKIIIIDNNGRFLCKEITKSEQPDNYSKFFNDEKESIKFTENWDGEYSLGLLIENDFEKYRDGNIERDGKFLKMVEVAEKYFKLIAEGENSNSEKLLSLQDELNQYEEMFSEDPIFVANLRLERKAKGL